MQVKNKTIIVTGAGSGIGRALVLELLQKNARVVGVDIKLDSLIETQRLVNVSADRFKIFQLDITDTARIEGFPKEVVAHFGPVDGIINNAGIIQQFMTVNEMSIEAIMRIINVNFYGTVYLTKAFLPLLMQRPEAHIVNISSMGGFIPFPKQTIYGAAKAAVKLFTEGLYAELKDSNVRVTVVYPGAVKTSITENSGLGEPKTESNGKHAGMALSAEKAAHHIIHAIEKNKYRVRVGRDAIVLDLLYRFNPKIATNFIGKMMKKVAM